MCGSKCLDNSYSLVDKAIITTITVLNNFLKLSDNLVHGRQFFKCLLPQTPWDDLERGDLLGDFGNRILWDGS